MRVVLKISGEYLKDDNNISNCKLEKVLKNISELKKDHELLIVVGGGNFWRGRNDLNINSDTSDYIGMLGTSMNALAISAYLNASGYESTCYNSFEIEKVLKKEDMNLVLNDLQNNKIVVFGGGLGYPGITTDMTTVTIADKYNADLILMAKNIDAIYDKDPKMKNAKRMNEITLEKLLLLLNNEYVLLDKASLDKLSKCHIPMYIYSAETINSIQEVINGEKGTKIIS